MGFKIFWQRKSAKQIFIIYYIIICKQCISIYILNVIIITTLDIFVHVNGKQGNLNKNMKFILFKHRDRLYIP